MYRSGESIEEDEPMPENGTFIWNELVTPDQEGSGVFFCRLLGWMSKAIETPGFGTYTLFQREGHDVAGMMNPTPDTPIQKPHWHGYIAVEDIDACVQRVPELGGTVKVPPRDIAEVGRVAVIADPSGAIVSLMQPAGLTLHASPGS